LVQYEAALIELEPGSSKVFVPKIHSLSSTQVDLEPGSSKAYAPKVHSLSGASIDLEPGSDRELALRFRSLTGTRLDSFGGPLSHYKPNYIRSREGEAFDVYGGPLTHYKPDYLRSREGSEFLTLWSLWADWGDLDCSFEVLRGWADLQGRFETGQGSVGLLARAEVGQDSGDLLARFESQTTRDLLARAEVGQDSEGLLGKIDIRHSALTELLSRCVIRQVGTPVELLVRVEVYHWDDLKGRLCVPKVYNFSDASGVAFFWWGAGRMDQYIDFEVRTPTGSWIGKFPDGPAEWRLIFLEWDDLVEVDLDGSRPDKSDINGFFWTYHTPGIRRLDALLAIEEPLFWHTDLCVADVYFFTRVTEKWNWDEQQIVTTVLEDTYTRLSYWVPGGNGGWQYATTNYGTSGYLRCSKFYGRPPGSYDTQIDDEEIFIKFALSGMGTSSLDRLGWARMELFRYYGNEYAKSRLNARRIAQCDETGVTYTFWNFDNVIGGCTSGRPHSATPPHAWSETAIAWYNTGRYHLTMGSVWWYMGLPGFTQSSPTSHYGLTTDNNVWDMIRVDEILASWLNGTYRNEGFGIRAEGIDGGDSSGEMNTFRETPRFYSSNAADPRKPRLRLQYIPEASMDLWSFASADRWEINLTDPYRGAGSLHLIDWTKVSYDRSRTNTSRATLQTDLAFAEGCVETVYRLNNATYPQLMYGAVYPPNKYVGYTTPIENFFRIYFRYQSTSNYYMIQLRPAGETSKIIRRRNAASTTLETFDSGIAVGDWERIRVFWVEDAGELHICCYIWDGADWSFLAGYADANNYWAAGGDVAFESYDAELDDTEISERIFP